MRIREDHFNELIERLKENSEDAAFELFELCKYRVYAAVRRRLNRQMRTKFDSQDFVQDMWASFFTNISQITRFNTEDELIGFLIRIAGNKVADEYRKRFKTEKHDINRERYLGDAFSSLTFDVVSPDPSPSAEAMANERWDQMLDQMPPVYKQILQLRRTGATMQQIADQLKVSERTVRRILKNLTMNEVN
ncbi:MAG TPA: sigma-70 family RNA polymerase sigma factor [Planctomycetaceae bacterium]|nr:sigma-70 family RNA polymerase sigma factor [Planctomycetaceae bacterium]